MSEYYEISWKIKITAQTFYPLQRQNFNLFSIPVLMLSLRAAPYGLCPGWGERAPAVQIPVGPFESLETRLGNAIISIHAISTRGPSFPTLHLATEMWLFLGYSISLWFKITSVLPIFLQKKKMKNPATHSLQIKKEAHNAEWGFLGWALTCFRFSSPSVKLHRL